MSTRRLWILPFLALALGTLAATLAQCGGDATAAMPPQMPAHVPAQSGQDPATPASASTPGDRIRILLSGSMLGRLEPCGCASGQLGGLARRMQHIGEQRNYDLLIEGGDLVEGTNELDVQKLFTALQILYGMQRPYDVLGVGQNDLNLPLAEWMGLAAMAPVVASDLTSTQPEWPGKPFVEKEVHGKVVRIASLSLHLPAALQTPDAPIHLLPPNEAWQKALAGAADSTLRVLLVNGSDAETRALVPELKPAPDLVACMDHGYLEPTVSPQIVAGVPIVFAGIRGRVLLDVWLERLPTGPRAICELVPLVGSKTVSAGGGDPDVKQVLLGHRNSVKDAGVLARLARQLPTANGAAYVGSDNCRSCHALAFAAWEKTRHHGAWETLQKAEADPKRYGWPVTFYPDCVSCHVVGYREQTGFVTFEETPQLAAVGCERCHGAGSDHVMTGGKKKLGLIGGVAASVLCVQCHDFEQSPDFLYQNKWPLIQHGK
ncbi:MAG: multiheme c-type cytochrome [Planctomycetota bacterium]